MREDLLTTLEQKVDSAVELIELLKLQIEELEQENALMQIEQEKWRNDLSALINKFDKIEITSKTSSTTEATSFEPSLQTG